MPREYGKNWFSMWTDEDFCTGRLFDKLLYQVLIGQSGTNDAGICPINLRKWRKAMRDGDQMPSELDVKAALVRQERRAYVFTDEDTGEVLIRSHIRNDRVFLQPAVLVSALRDLKACQSPKFAAVMLAELDRIELPEVKATTKQGERLRDSLKLTYDAARTHLQTLSEGLVEPLPEPFIEDFPEGLPEPFSRPGKTEPFDRPFPEGSQEPPVVVEVEVVKSPSRVTQVGEDDEPSAETGQRQPNRTRNEPPPERCPKHLNDPNPPACGACGGHRRFRERWDAEHAEDRQREATLADDRRRLDAQAAINACRLCDFQGHVQMPDLLGDSTHASTCSHDADELDRARNEILAAREQMAE